MYGAPADFSLAKLPNHGEVGCQYEKVRLDLKAKSPTNNVSELQICKLVSKVREIAKDCQWLYDIGKLDRNLKPDVWPQTWRGVKESY